MTSRHKPQGSDGAAPQTSGKQSGRFVEAARELGCDDSEEAFAEKVRRVAKPRPAEQKRNRADS